MAAAIVQIVDVVNDIDDIANDDFNSSHKRIDCRSKTSGISGN